MRRLAVVTLLLLSACGSTPSNHPVAHPDGGSHCDAGAACGTTGSTRQRCTVDKDCTLGTCKLGAGGLGYCQVQCSIDNDCPAGSYCNHNAVCAVRPATTASSSTGTTGVGPTGSGPSTTGSSTGVGVSGATATSSSSTTGTTGTSATASTTTGTTATSATSTTTGTTATSTTASTTTGTSTTASTTGTTGTSATSSTTGTTGTSTTASTTGTTGTSTTASSTTGTTTSGTTGSSFCTASSCPAGQGCNYGTGTCMPLTGASALGANCNSFSDCQSGDCEYVFGQPRCTQPCGASGQCPANFVCLYAAGSGSCVDQAVAFNGYTVGTAQVDDACTPQAAGSTHGDCHSAYYCSGNTNPADGGTLRNFCIDSCGTDADCRVTTQAQTDNFACIAGPTGGSSKAPYCWFNQGGGTCSTDSDCGGISGACDTTRGHCVMGESCTSDASCAHYACYQGTTSKFCSKPCTSYYDCPGTASQTTCLPTLDSAGDVIKLCVATPTGSSLGSGAACDITNPSACYSGVCVRTSAAPGSTSGFCSSTCATDGDCASLSENLPDGGTGPAPECRLRDSGLRYPDGGSVGVTGTCIRR